MLALIVNPSAGGGRAGATLPVVTARLREHGLEYEVDTVPTLAQARELAARVACAGDVAVAFGGDGLVGAVAGGLRGSDGILGVLPAGRGNDFARVLGIPLDPVTACDVLASGSARRIDLGCAGDRWFVGVASCGFDSDANRIANATRVVRGSLVYTYAGIRALLRWRPARFELVVDGVPRSLTGYTVAVANSSTYGGGMRIAPGASLDDGRLDVVLIAQMSRLAFLRSLPKVFRGDHILLPEVSTLRAREVSVRADRRFTVYADGEPAGELPLTMTVEPGAIRVIVPADGPACQAGPIGEQR
jgi:YegS/Rv2252/BmrU family lipid kinase